MRFRAEQRRFIVKVHTITALTARRPIIRATFANSNGLRFLFLSMRRGYLDAMFRPVPLCSPTESVITISDTTQAARLAA